jgi:uncharacterized membrane protein YvbJ
MFCKNCGQEIDDNADICIHCGVATGKRSSLGNTIDSPSHLAGIASCCFPIAGIILYFIWKDEKPKSASLVCKWMIGGTIAWIIVYILSFVAGILISLASN